MSILFGRSRSSEDIDLILGKLDEKRFHELWVKLNEKFECLNSSKESEAFDLYLDSGHGAGFIYDAFCPLFPVSLE